MRVLPHPAETAYLLSIQLSEPLPSCRDYSGEGYVNFVFSALVLKAICTCHIDTFLWNTR